MEAFCTAIMAAFLVLPGLPFVWVMDLANRLILKNNGPASLGVGIVLSGVIAIPVTIICVGFLAYMGATTVAAIWSVGYLISWAMYGVMQIT